MSADPTRTEPPDDPVALVAEGYDRIAQRYLESSGLPGVKRQQLDRLLGLLEQGSDVLELGCGAGEPVTRELSAAHNVTAVDVSAVQLDLAARHAPGARLIQADLSRLDLPAASFDAVVAFYSLTHVPRDRHTAVLEQVARWLRPGGLFFATMGANDDPGAVEEDWLGAPMYFSHFDAATNRGLVEAAGLDIDAAEVIDQVEDGVRVPFLWVLARRPVAAPAQHG